MIKRIKFWNFKTLREADLPLSNFTLLVGPNGSGKSTAMTALTMASGRSGMSHSVFASLDVYKQDNTRPISIEIHWGGTYDGTVTTTTWGSNNSPRVSDTRQNKSVSTEIVGDINSKLANTKIYALNPSVLANQGGLSPSADLSHDGSNLVVVLDRLRDDDPERFERLNKELGRMVPEYERIVFHTPANNVRSFSLRTRYGGHVIQARELSQGTLLALTFLTLAYLPRPPAIMCLEEPDRGIHPRLLRDIRDALYRLAYPDKFDESREPVQVLATTHSPFLLDLYRDHPEEVVIARKDDHAVTFQCLSDRNDLDEILEDSHLGEIWYSGILGGVPVGK